MPNWINKKPKAFKDIPRYSGRYAIAKDGRVYSYPKYRWKGKIIISHAIPSHTGFYMRVALIDEKGRKRSEGIHRLMMETYKPRKNSSLLQVNHKNGIKNDNRLENLEWCTTSENVRHATELGLRPITEKMRSTFRRHGSLYGAKNGLAVCRPINQLALDKSIIKTFASTMDASRATGISYRAINNALRKHMKKPYFYTSGGFFWVYANSRVKKALKGE